MKYCFHNMMKSLLLAFKYFFADCPDFLQCLRLNRLSFDPKVVRLDGRILKKSSIYFLVNCSVFHPDLRLVYPIYLVLLTV